MSDSGSNEVWVEFERLYRAHGLRVRRHLTYLTGDPVLAQDLAQEAFGRLYEALAQGSAEPIRNSEAWLMRVASNLAYNHFRAESRRTARETDPDASAPMHAEPHATVDDVLDVRSALARLETRDRVALMLRHTGFSYAEIAEAIEVSPASVGTVLVRAQARFKNAYEGARSAEKE